MLDGSDQDFLVEISSSGQAEYVQKLYSNATKAVSFGQTSRYTVQGMRSTVLLLS